MAQVNTVLGPIRPEEMGITAMHEHIGFGVPGWQYVPERWWEETDRFEKVTNDLLDFKMVGCVTFVDLSGIGMGRDPDFYACVSRSSGVHIVAATGFWEERGILGYFRDKDIDYLEELFVHEITQGMNETNIKAGIIKVGNSDSEMTAFEEKMYRAAARAAKRTGVAVTTHGPKMARKQMEVLLSEKLDISRIIIGHRDNANALDMELDKELCRQGVFIGYDTIGSEEYSPMPYVMADGIRVDMVKKMVDLGFVNNLLLSMDTSSWGLGWGRNIGPSRIPNGPALHGYSHMVRYFVPMLQKAGISEKDIHVMLVENPKRALPMG
ncbi:MAG: hypothetical protein Q7R34_13325 [Dehalococcoidia bacterium]|nr:hypothetical protein [Dehalococcoidia bacterium]